MEQFLRNLLPFADVAITIVAATRLLPMLVIGGALYFLFVSLTPQAYKGRQFPKWPGAAFTAVWWYATTLLLPVVLSQLGGYDLTYGSLAGVMIALIFFFVIGLRSEEHTSELQSLMRISYAVFCLNKKKKYTQQHH